MNRASVRQPAGWTLTSEEDRPPMTGRLPRMPTISTRMTGLRGSPIDSGAVAPDGSPVAFHLQLPAGRDPDVVHAAIEPGCEVLELGCGTGRMTHRLIELGHPVLAI